jgi:hypothetical protein
VSFLLLASLLAACGGDDSSDDEGSSGSGSGSDATNSEYLGVLTSLFSRSDEGAAIANNESEAKCTAERIVDDVGQRRLIEAGLTTDALADDTLTKEGFPDLTSAEATAIIDAMFHCIDFGKQLLAIGDAAQQQCVQDELTRSVPLRSLYQKSFLEGRQRAGLDEAAARSLVDSIFECVPQGGYFRSATAGSITVTDEQAACLDTSLASSNDFRDAIAQRFMGRPATDVPPYADEVERCMTREQLTPTTTG